MALANILREYPHHELHLQTGPKTIPIPRQLHPCFYGSYDWHSCVGMFWVLVRLLRLAPDDVPQAEIRRVLNEHLTADALAAEAAYFAAEDQRTNQRPYGWGALLELAGETATWTDPDAHRWAPALQNLAGLFTARYLHWLPRATYPVRHGVHTNSAFGLSRALPFAHHLAQHDDRRLLDAITAAALRWFAQDADYPAAWEPSGADFLSPALAEAELMARLLASAQFADWLRRFLPGIAERRPRALFTPAIVSDATDGQIAHLHGLNLSRAWCWQRLAETLPGDDARVAIMLTAARDHAHASLPHAVGSCYTVEHWLAYYAVLLLT